MQPAPIGIFDSGYGGLTILKEFIKVLPENDFIYLGDNARTPYGTRSFESIYNYTLECVRYLFDQGCTLVILACNTASARALRTIQQKDLPLMNGKRRVLGIIRPSAEVIGKFTQSRKVGVLGTRGTVKSGSYIIEIKKLYPDIEVFQEACPMWVPLVENKEYDNEGAAYFVQKNLENLFKQNAQIDTILLGCTHYPLLIQTIQKHLPSHVKVISQGPIVAESLVDYLNRHPEIAGQCSKNGRVEFFTTDSTHLFDENGSLFFGKPLTSKFVSLS
jgi:glutamate racemase